LCLNERFEQRLTLNNPSSLSAISSEKSIINKVGGKDISCKPINNESRGVGAPKPKDYGKQQTMLIDIVKLVESPERVVPSLSSVFSFSEILICE